MILEWNLILFAHSSYHKRHLIGVEQAARKDTVRTMHLLKWRITILKIHSGRQDLMPQVPIHELVSRLRCCTDDNFTDVRHIHQLLRKSVVDPGSLETYLIWDRQHYTRNLID